MTTNVTVTTFIDYDNVRWYASQLFGIDRHLSPYALATTICEDLQRSNGDHTTTELAFALAAVRVYVPRPRKVGSRRKRHNALLKGWRRSGEREQVEILSPDVNGYDEPKEIHSQMCVDLLRWARSTQVGVSVPEIAVVFSNDRDLRPAVSEIGERFQVPIAPRVDFAGWAGQEQDGRGWEWIATIESTTVQSHFLTWEAYEAYEANASEVAMRGGR